jgi:Icc-related predicted phosphoesterase
MRIVCLSDTHLRHAGGPAIPDGDVLVHAGDFTKSGTLPEVAAFDAFLATLPHPRKIVVAGNHDFLFQNDPGTARGALAHATYLEDSEVTIDGVRIWGAPWQPWFHDWAFNLARGDEIRARWDLIPAGIDILVTHGPPLGHGDALLDGQRVGCADLLDAIRRVQPRYHVFGHIHEGYGQTQEGPTTCINASWCDLRYQARNAPVVIECSGRRA